MSKEKRWFPLTPGEDYTTERGGMWYCLKAGKNGAKIMDEYTGKCLRITEIELVGETVDEGRNAMPVIRWGNEKFVGYENF